MRALNMAQASFVSGGDLSGVLMTYGPDPSMDNAGSSSYMDPFNSGVVWGVVAAIAGAAVTGLIGWYLGSNTQTTQVQVCNTTNGVNPATGQTTSTTTCVTTTTSTTKTGGG
jgi:hypothetical protein